MAIENAVRIVAGKRLAQDPLNVNFIHRFFSNSAI